MSKDDALNVMKNSNLNVKCGLLSYFLSCKKIKETTYYQRNKEAVLNRAKEYH